MVETEEHRCRTCFPIRMLDGPDFVLCKGEDGVTAIEVVVLDAAAHSPS